MHWLRPQGAVCLPGDVCLRSRHLRQVQTRPTRNAGTTETIRVANKAHEGPRTAWNFERRLQKVETHLKADTVVRRLVRTVFAQPILASRREVAVWQEVGVIAIIGAFVNVAHVYCPL